MGLATAKQLLERGIDTLIIGSSSVKLNSAIQALDGKQNLDTLQANL